MKRPYICLSLVLNILIFSTFALGQNLGIVSRQGNQFILNGSPFYFAGSNNYYQMAYAADPGLRYAVDEVQEEMAAMGMTVLRTWAFNDGAGQWNALQTNPGVYQEYVFQGLDYVLYKADQLGLKLILPLVNNWDDYGGMNQYVQWSDSLFPGSVGFVQINGTHFEVNGKPYCYVGANYWYGLNLASNGPGGDRPRLLNELDSLRACGITNLRVMAGSEGPDSEPWRMVPSLQTSPGVYDYQVLEGLDYLLYSMKEREIRAVMVLNNFWHWSGGMAQYVRWNGGDSIPYPPPEPGGSWDEFQDYASDFYSNPGAMEDFRNHISFIINRTNPYIGLAYRDDPTVMSWELGNEPRGWNNNTADFNTWIDSTAAYIKSLDTNHLVTTGCEGNTPWPEWNGLDFYTNHDGSDIDYTTIHIWPQNWDWYDPADPVATYSTAESNARQYFNDHLADAMTLAKPMVLEEFGLARDLGSYDPASTTVYRDSFYTAMFEEVYASASSGGPAAGYYFWAWAGEGRPLEPYGSYWNPGDPWIGDPPHEHQGWYSVYDADVTTLTVISDHAEQMRALTPDGVHDDFYTDELCREYYRNHVSTVLNRVNTFNGRLYREDPAIFAWELANEPECLSDLSGDILQDWIEEMAAYVRSIDTLHMVTTGSEGFYGPTGPAHNPYAWMGQKGVDFTRNHQCEDIDFACFHLYPDYWSLNLTTSTNWITNHIQDAEALLGKPLILEEYGKQEPIATRDQYFQAWLDAVYDGALTGLAAAGSNLWILYNDDYQNYDGFGVYYPEHTSTIAILESHAEDMNLLTEAFASSANGVKISGFIEGAVEEIIDDFNLASLDSGAGDGYDAGLDIPEPLPPATDYLTVYFPHPEWGSPVGNNFRVDIRNANDNLTNAVKIFTFKVETDHNGDTVELDFTIGDEFPGGYGVVLYDSVQSVYRNLREGGIYSFTAGSEARSFNLRLGDETAPEINIIFPPADTLLYGNQSYNLIWENTDISPIRYSKVYYSPDDGASWTLIDSISGGGQSCNWTVPDTTTDSAKIKIESEDWPGNVGTEITDYTFSLASGCMENYFNAGWHMISIPLIPECASIDSIFGDDIQGGYFVYNYHQSSGYELVEEVEHGAGYWLALDSAAMVDLEGTPAADSVFLPMTWGWNIVGAAMTESLPLNSILFSDGNTIQAFTQAVNESWISPAFYQWDNENSIYQTAVTLFPWGGYWLQALQEGLQMITGPSGDDSREYPAKGDETDDENDWFVSVTVVQGGLRDQLAGFGVDSLATDEYDTWFDLPTAPVPPSGEYVRLIFYHPEWSALAGDTFSQDIRAPLESVSSAVWEGTIEASDSGEVTVSFENIAQLLPQGYLASAEYSGETVNLLETSSFVINYTEPCEICITVSNFIPRIEDLTISVSGDDIVLNWSEITMAAIYYVYRAEQPYFDIAGLSPIDSTATSSYTDVGALSGGRFFYRVTFDYSEASLTEITCFSITDENTGCTP